MLLYIRSYGQMCNRLWSLLPPVSLAIEREEKLHIVFNNETDLRDFPALGSSKNIHVVSRFDPRRLSSFLYRLLAPLDIKTDMGEAVLSPHKIYVINSWKHICDKAYIQNHKQALLSIFSFKTEVIEKVKKSLHEYEGITIGVHIRRGDYKQWREGLYYYENITYENAMLSIASQVKANGKKCRFVVCSNEPFNVKLSGIDIIQIPNASGMDDLCALSQCDYIIGPPSSFSQWASFYGDVPLRFLLDANEKVDLSEFSPIIGMNAFQNGKRLIDVDGVRFRLQ